MKDKKQIEEMAKDIYHAITKECRLNTYGHCNDCEFNVPENTNEIDCQSYLISKILRRLNYRKLPKNAVVIDLDENPCLSCPVPEDIQRDVDCSTICGAVRLGIDWKNQGKALVKENKKLNKQLEQIREQTAREILQDLWNKKFESTITIPHRCSVEDIENVGKAVLTSIGNRLCELAKQYGVEIGE